MPKVTEAKRQVLVRVPERLYEILLRMSTEETLRRNMPVSVPALINEKLETWLQGKKQER